MATKTNEQALESAVEKALTGTCLEELKSKGSVVAEPAAIYGNESKFQIGYAENFDPKYALDTFHFWHFLATTQMDELEKLKRSSDWKLKIIERFDKMVKKYGILRMLRKGLEVDDAHLTLFTNSRLSAAARR